MVEKEPRALATQLHPAPAFGDHRLVDYDEERTGDGEHAYHGAARLPGAPGHVDGPGSDRGFVDRLPPALPATTKALRACSPEGPLRCWTVPWVPPCCLRDLLAGSDNAAALRQLGHILHKRTRLATTESTEERPAALLCWAEAKPPVAALCLEDDQDQNCPPGMLTSSPNTEPNASRRRQACRCRIRLR